jgi:hypothetical protein
MKAQALGGNADDILMGPFGAWILELGVGVRCPQFIRSKSES